jgi:hypothetical protein
MKETSYKGPHIVQLHVYKVSRVGKSIETERRLVAARGGRGNGKGMSDDG